MGQVRGNMMESAGGLGPGGKAQTWVTSHCYCDFSPGFQTTLLGCSLLQASTVLRAPQTSSLFLLCSSPHKQKNPGHPSCSHSGVGLLIIQEHINRHSGLIERSPQELPHSTWPPERHLGLHLHASSHSHSHSAPSSLWGQDSWVREQVPQEPPVLPTEDGSHQEVLPSPHSILS